ncbi:hypothetical protein ElyMa_004863200 [Elysia marginata]|uniref:Uncharacterized protein n=1 Tax=Elysia marginata TaxID=1093978 RepID=A0AAV4IPU7_9GAST|nr:hypothetical protein ElyMa_004863200 [Elysia marginata]
MKEMGSTQRCTTAHLRGTSEKKQEKGHNSDSFNGINLKLAQIKVSLFPYFQRNPHGDRCIFSSATAANRYLLERNQGQDVQTNSLIHRRGHLLYRNPCLLNDTSRVQTNESQRIRGLDFGQNEEEYPNRSAAAIAAQNPISRIQFFATNCISRAVKSAAV